jgi:hypothetical protein
MGNCKPDSYIDAANVVDPDPVHFGPGSGIGKKNWIRDEHPRSFFRELINSFKG